MQMVVHYTNFSFWSFLFYCSPSKNHSHWNWSS